MDQRQEGYRKLAEAIMREEQTRQPAEKPRRKNKRAGRIRQGDTICWTCARVTGGQGCSWVASYRPVPGWEAAQTAFFYRDENGQTVRNTSYLVKTCPLHQKG